MVVTRPTADDYVEAAEARWKRLSRHAERRAKNAERALREMRDEDLDVEPNPPALAGQTKGEPNGSV